MSAGRKKLKQIPRAMLLRVLIPTLFSSLSLALANIADALTVGIRVGGTGLAAIGIVTPIYMIYNVVALSFGSGGGVTHARLMAEGREQLALVHFRKTVAWTLGISVAVGLAGGLFPETVLRMLAAREDFPELWRMCREYAVPLLAGCPLILMNMMLYYFVQSDDHPRTAALAFTVGGLLDLGLNILLVLVLDWGVRGAVWSTLAASAVSVLILCTHFFSKQGILRVRAVLTAREEVPGTVKKTVAASFRNGFSSSVSYVFQFALQLMMNHLLMRAGRSGSLPGDLGVAVFDLVLNISFLAMPVYTAVGDALQPAATTFSAERDTESLRLIRRMSLQYGLAGGVAVGGLLALLAGPLAALFGLGQAEQAAAAVPAVRIYLLSVPFAGLVVMQCRYCQAVGDAWHAFIGTLLREALFPLPITLILGLAAPESIWWSFPLAAAAAAAAFQAVLSRQREAGAGAVYPACRLVMTNSSQDLGEVLEGMEAFCQAQEIPPEKAMHIQLAVEELCAVTMRRAFRGDRDEFIQVALVVKPGPEYELHIRDSAPFFNPLDMRMEKARKDMETEIMESIGVMLVKKQSRSMTYRHYQGFNTLTVVYA